MIDVLCETESSVIRRIHVKGHASRSSDNRVVCSAVSVLTRTVCELAARYRGIASECSAPEPGDVVLVIHNVEKGFWDIMSGVTDYFLTGVIAVKEEFPESVKLKINNKDWYNGTQERWW